MCALLLRPEPDGQRSLPRVGAGASAGRQRVAAARRCGVASLAALISACAAACMAAAAAGCAACQPLSWVHHAPAARVHRQRSALRTRRASEPAAECSAYCSLCSPQVPSRPASDGRMVGRPPTSAVRDPPRRLQPACGSTACLRALESSAPCRPPVRRVVHTLAEDAHAVATIGRRRRVVQGASRRGFCKRARIPMTTNT